MTPRLFSRAGLLVLALVTLLATIAINLVFKNTRLDLTEDKLFTLSEGTHNLLGQLEEKATLQLFYSESQTRELPFLRNYSRRVRELLEEYVLVSGGKLGLEVIDPEPFSENEDKASEFGLQAVPLGGAGNEAYFGLVITNDADNSKQEVIGFLHPDKERFLEYDISKLVYAVTQTTKPKVGIVAGLPVNGGYDMQTRQPSDPWTSIFQLRQTYDVTELEANFQDIAEDIKLLVVIHPKELSDPSRYAIDQFVLRGGNALVFVDPNAESDQSGGGMMGGMMMGMGGDKSSTLEPRFKAWGIEMSKEKVLADAGNALSVSSPSGRPVRHLGIIGLGPDSFNKDDVITASLSSVNFATTGTISQVENSKTNVEVLLQSSSNAMLMGADKFAFLFDPSSLYKDFKATGEQYSLAVRVTGSVVTAYPDGRPVGKEPEETTSADLPTDPVITKEEEEEEEEKEQPVEEVQTEKTSSEEQVKGQEKKVLLPHVSTSKGAINVIVVADTDVLTDRLWVQKSSFFGQQIVQPFASNGDLLTNMVDNLLGNADLISIRSRGQFSRPFTKVNELEMEAETNFYQKEDELKKQLSDTEAKLRELQGKKEGGDALVLSTEQEQEVERFVQEKLRIRKELREVQHQLGKDIALLGNWLKVINILAVPLLITLFVLGFRVYRRRKC